MPKRRCRKKSSESHEKTSKCIHYVGCAGAHPVLFALALARGVRYKSLVTSHQLLPLLAQAHAAEQEVVPTEVCKV
jgi:hypothetical protein